MQLLHCLVLWVVSSVAKVYQTVCDICGKVGDGVRPVVVRRGDASWELDLDDKCYKSRFGDLEKVGRKPSRRTRHSYQIVEPLN